MTDGAGPVRPFLHAAVAHRERRHRRLVKLGVAVLLVLSILPVASHAISAVVASSLAGRDHLGALCLVALHYVLAPVHGVFHVLMLTGLLVATADRVRAWRQMHRMLEPLDRRPPAAGDPFWRAARTIGLDPGVICVTPGLPSPALTAGCIRPVVYVAEELPDRLERGELAAVLAHEASHVWRRDPLRLSALRFLSRALFWLPPVACLADDLADEAEIVADDAAAERGSLVFASALVALAREFGSRAQSERHALGVAEVLAGASPAGDLLEHRVRRLVGEEVAPRSHVTARCAAVGCTALLLALASSVAVVHPLPAQGPESPSHCTHHQLWSATHLFCRGGATSTHDHRDRVTNAG